jgi:hypothetical protein
MSWFLRRECGRRWLSMEHCQVFPFEDWTSAQLPCWLRPRSLAGRFTDQLEILPEGAGMILRNGFAREALIGISISEMSQPNKQKPMVGDCPYAKKLGGCARNDGSQCLFEISPGCTSRSCVPCSGGQMAGGPPCLRWGWYNYVLKGEAKMANKGNKDTGKREEKKKPKLTIKEKRKLKKQKEQTS